ncbi:hypothetical protein [Chlamydia felis Fe/C-56]|uniref:Uncharacterized protein n=1 Tax=Chlamydia felis (strain Fe/C-56) TaxID=264202 RepID=Q254U1_CHLFF|nr:membrane protein [Chlamydia felis]BAE81197.1 hypothetical protein [Chlamydia felis Fe/C-56]
MSNPIPTQNQNISPFPLTPLPTEINTNLSQRQTSLRLFLDTMLIVLGFSTVVSIFVAIFFLNGLNMLNATTIALSLSLILIGFVFISIGVLFFVNNIEQGLYGVLRKRLKQAETEVKELKSQLQIYELNQAFAPAEEAPKTSSLQETSSEPVVEIQNPSDTPNH